MSRRNNNKEKPTHITFLAGFIPSLCLHWHSKESVTSFCFLWLSLELQCQAAQSPHVPGILGPPSPGKQHHDMAQSTPCPLQGDLPQPCRLMDGFDFFSTLGKCQLNLWKHCAMKNKTSDINRSFSVQFLLQLLQVCSVCDLNLWLNSHYPGR